MVMRMSEIKDYLSSIKITLDTREYTQYIQRLSDVMVHNENTRKAYDAIERMQNQAQEIADTLHPIDDYRINSGWELPESILESIYKFQDIIAESGWIADTCKISYSDHLFYNEVLRVFSTQSSSLYELFNNRELLLCADDIVNELANNSQNSDDLETLNAALLEPEQGIDLEAIVLLSYSLAIPVFLLICVRGGTLTQDDLMSIWLHILKILTGSWSVVWELMEKIATFGGVYAFVKDYVIRKKSDTYRQCRDKHID